MTIVDKQIAAMAEEALQLMSEALSSAEVAAHPLNSGRGAEESRQEAVAAVQGLAHHADNLASYLGMAIDMLAQWCVAIDRNGTGWDDWDEHYKNAAYRANPLREQLDKAIAAVKKEYGDE